MSQLLDYQVSPSWLALDGYHVDQCFFQVDKEFQDSMPKELVLGTGLHPQIGQPIKETALSVEIGLTAGIHPDDPRKLRFQIDVHSSTPQEEFPRMPYEFGLLLTAYFTVSDQMEINVETSKLLHQSAANMMYGVTREIISSLTGRGMFPGMQLPSIVFQFEVPTRTKTKQKLPKKNTRSASKKKAAKPTKKS